MGGGPARAAVRDVRHPSPSAIWSWSSNAADSTLSFSGAETAGIGLYGGCLLESSIGAAAHLHAFAGLRELGWGCEHFGPQILAADLVTEPLHFADFHVHMPAGPGIGVALDHDKLRRYARQ